MKPPAKLGLYGIGLVALFAAAFAIADTTVSEETVMNWSETTDEHAAGGHETATESAAAVRGLSLEQDGYRLQEVRAPGSVSQPGSISFAIVGADGNRVTEYETSHEKQLHLIVVRSDGTEFRHAHPRLDADGVWALPWEWKSAGTHRIFADFVPAASGEDVTLTRIADVAGEFDPVKPPSVSRSSRVAGFDVTLSGSLSASEASTLTATVSRDGAPVTTLQPYLGAYGHLVALREGDLAYLHVHPEGDEPSADSVSGPDVEFMTEAPTPGRYLLYLDFKVDGQVHTAEFVLDAAERATPVTPTPSAPDKPSDHSGH